MVALYPVGERRIPLFDLGSAGSSRAIANLHYSGWRGFAGGWDCGRVPIVQRLTNECNCALRRIFHLCDRDADGILSDDELNSFQKKCFDAPLTAEEIGNIKTLLREASSGGDSSSGTQPAAAAHGVAMLRRGGLTIEVFHCPSLAVHQTEA